MKIQFNIEKISITTKVLKSPNFLISLRRENFWKFHLNPVLETENAGAKLRGAPESRRETETLLKIEFMFGKFVGSAF